MDRTDWMGAWAIWAGSARQAIPAEAACYVVSQLHTHLTLVTLLLSATCSTQYITGFGHLHTTADKLHVELCEDVLDFVTCHLVGRSQSASPRSSFAMAPKILVSLFFSLPILSSGGKSVILHISSSR